MKQNRIMIIGLTGNTGSGKGAVSEILTKLGAHIVDADRIAHDILHKDGAAYKEIVESFDGILDNNGNIDRKKLGEQVFGEESKRRNLMKITHKYIIEEMKREANEAIESGKYRFIVLDAPLLIEAGLHTYADEVWLVSADRETRLQRIIERDGITKQIAEKRADSQTKFEELKKYAAVIIENNGDLVSLANVVTETVNRRVR